MLKKIQVEEVKAIKYGVHNGRNWTLYRITDRDGTQYSTFDTKYLDTIGSIIEVNVEEKQVVKDGKAYNNLTIQEPKKINPDLELILSKLDEILRIVKQDIPQSPEVGGHVNETPPNDDLPF